MKISDIEIHHFRKLAHLQASFSNSRFHLILGDNGQGKTSLLEAIHLVATGKSFQNAKFTDLIQFDHSVASVHIKLQKESSPVHVTTHLGFSSEKKIFTLNQQEVKPFSKGVGSFHTVLFRNADESLFTGTPEKRRQALDMFLSLSDPAYMKTLIHYKKIILHRNHLLRKKTPSSQEFSYWNEALIEGSVNIIKKRLVGLVFLQEKQAMYLKKLGIPFDQFKLEYLLSSREMIQNDHCLKDKLRSALKNMSSLERERQYSMTGAHTDDFLVSKDEHNIKKFASQGQIKAIMCAFRLAENDYYLMNAEGESPIILIDDCLRDLSQPKQHAFWRIVESLNQDVFFAGTERPDFFNDSHVNYVHYVMNSGQIKASDDSCATL